MYIRQLLGVIAAITAILGCRDTNVALSDPMQEIARCGIASISGSGLTSLIYPDDSVDVAIDKSRWADMKDIFLGARKWKGNISGPAVGTLTIVDNCGNTTVVQFYISAQAPLIFDVDGERYSSEYRKELFDPCAHLLGIIEQEKGRRSN